MNSEKQKPTAYESIKSRCDEAGIKISAVCRKAGVDRSVLERWKPSDPKSIQNLNAFNDAIDELIKEKENV